VRRCSVCRLQYSVSSTQSPVKIVIKHIAYSIQPKAKWAVAVDGVKKLLSLTWLPALSQVMNQITVTIERRTHRGAQCLFLRFTYHYHFKEHLKQLKPIRWSKTHRGFYLPERPGAIKKLEEHLRGWGKVRLVFKGEPLQSPRKKAIPDRPGLPRDKRELLVFYKNYLIGKRYSESTLRVYTGFVKDFLSYHRNTDPGQLNGDHVRLFVEWAVKEHRYSISTHRQLVSALKHFAFFYPNCAIDPEALERPKKQRKLPVVLSMEEVMRILQATRNLKHKVIIALLYSSGLRIGELLDLKLDAFDVERRMLHIKSGKGKKDRYTQLADSVLPLIRTYYDAYRPAEYFVEGPRGGRYSASSVRNFLRKSCKLAGIGKHVTPHTLRHSYATHLLENGTGLRYIQELLGHSKPETTMVYTHVSSHDLTDVTSPLDTLAQRFRDPENKHLQLSFGKGRFPDKKNKK